MYQAFMYLNTCVSFHLRLQMLKSLNEAYNTVLCFWISVFHFSISFSKISRRPSSVLFWNTFPAWKVSKYEVFPGPYFPVFSRNKQNTDQKILRIRILFTQWFPIPSLTLFRSDAIIIQKCNRKIPLTSVF